MEKGKKKKPGGREGEGGKEEEVEEKRQLARRWSCEEKKSFGLHGRPTRVRTLHGQYSTDNCSTPMKKKKRYRLRGILSRRISSHPIPSSLESETLPRSLWPCNPNGFGSLQYAVSLKSSLDTKYPP